MTHPGIPLLIFTFTVSLLALPPGTNAAPEGHGACSGTAQPKRATLSVSAIFRAIVAVLEICAALAAADAPFLRRAGGPDAGASVHRPDSATLSVSAILRAIVSVLEICAALAAADATLLRGAEGAVLALPALLALPARLASVGVMTLA